MGNAYPVRRGVTRRHLRDVNRDGYLNFSDVSCLVRCILGSAPPHCQCAVERADTQNDGGLSFADASRLASAVLGRISTGELICELRPTNERP